MEKILKQHIYAEQTAVFILKHLFQIGPEQRMEWGQLSREIIEQLLIQPSLSLISHSSRQRLHQKHSCSKSLIFLSKYRHQSRQLNTGSAHPLISKYSKIMLKSLLQISYRIYENPETYISHIIKFAEANPTVFCRALAQTQSFHYKNNQKKFQNLTWWLIDKVKHEIILLTDKEYSQLLYLNGHLNYVLNRLGESDTKIQESKYKNGKNTKARRQSLKISIRKGDFSGCIWQVKVLWQYSTTKSCQFQVIKAVAQFLTKGSQQVWQEITNIKQELQAFPDREKNYLDANFSLGILHFLLSDDNKAFKYFAKEYQVNKNDISLVRLMGLSRYRMKDYASAMEYFNRVRELRPDLPNDNELLMTMICCLKTESEDVAMQIMPQIEERANCPRNMKYTWPYSLYLGILYHLREDLKAIQCYSRLECKYSSDFEIMQLKIVMILCYHRRGEGQKVMELLEEIQAIQAKLQLHKILINQHFIHTKQLIFLVNYCQTNKLNQLQLNFSQSIGKLIDYTNKTYGVPSMIEPLIQRQEDFEIQFACQ